MNGLASPEFLRAKPPSPRAHERKPATPRTTATLIVFSTPAVTATPQERLKFQKRRRLRLESSLRAPWAAGCAGNKPVFEALGEQGLALDEGQL